MDKTSVLSESALFEMLSPEEIGFLAELARPKVLARGQVVFREGELGDAVFVIARGEVEVVRHCGEKDERTLAVLGSREAFGEMSLIDKEYRSATLRAVSDSEVLQITAENLMAFRKRHRDGFTFIAINIARLLSRRLREANLKLEASAPQRGGDV